MSRIPTVPLDARIAIPQLGLGVYQISPQETARTVWAALEIGYRHIDTAQMYGNEAGVGKAVGDFGRERVFVTSKLDNGVHRPDDARRAFAGTLEALRSDYVDLFLIHWPLPTLYDGDYVSTWRTLTEFHADGRARAIGVSNFQVDHLDRLHAETGVRPAVNQIEVHPYFGNEQVRAHCHVHGIVIEAWSPIAKGQVLADQAVLSVASAVARTPAQVVLRWHVQRGDVIFPKSASPRRMRENAAVFDFVLNDEQMQAITNLDRGEAGRIGPHPDTFDYIG